MYEIVELRTLRGESDVGPGLLLSRSEVYRTKNAPEAPREAWFLFCKEAFLMA